MSHLLSCEFNIDTACVELKYADGSMISIDTIAVENEVADNMYERSELDWLIYVTEKFVNMGNIELYEGVLRYEKADYPPIPNFICTHSP